jgi:hypothetical protein
MAPVSLGTHSLGEGPPLELEGSRLHLQLRPAGTGTAGRGDLTVRMYATPRRPGASPEAVIDATFDSGELPMVRAIGRYRVTVLELVEAGGHVAAEVTVDRVACPAESELPPIPIAASRTVWLSTVGTRHVDIREEGATLAPVTLELQVDPIRPGPAGISVVGLNTAVLNGGVASNRWFERLDPRAPRSAARLDNGAYRFELVRTVLGDGTAFAPPTTEGSSESGERVRAEGPLPAVSTLVRVTHLAVPSRAPR